MAKCKIKAFGDIDCPHFNNPNEDCWYDVEYRCKRINKLNGLSRRIKQIRNNK